MQISGRFHWATQYNLFLSDLWRISGCTTKHRESGMQIRESVRKSFREDRQLTGVGNAH